MKRKTHFLISLVLVPAAALTGNWLGGWLRFFMTGQHVSSLRFYYNDEAGYSFSNFPVITKFYPAVLLSFLGRPRWFLALISGVATGAVLDDRLERQLWGRFLAPLFIRRLYSPTTPAQATSTLDD